jgi:hypothetical protein
MRASKCKYCGIRVYSERGYRIVCDRCKKPHHLGGYIRNPKHFLPLNNETKNLNTK